MRVLGTEKNEVNVIVNVSHKKSYQRPHFDRLTKCWIGVLLDVHSGVTEKIFILI